MIPKHPLLKVSTILAQHVEPESPKLEMIAKFGGLDGADQLVNLMRGEAVLPLAKAPDLANACRADIGELTFAALAEAHPAAFEALSGAWSGGLADDERKLLAVYRACSGPEEIEMDRETCDRVAVAIAHGFDDA